MFLTDRLFGFIWELGSRVLAEILGPRVTAWLKAWSLPPVVRRWFNLRSYRTKLPIKLQRMPFIYAGIESDVLNDFVAIELSRMDPSTLDLKEADSAFKLDPWRMLKDRRYVAIIGSAGIGKTTFQRHTILEVLSKSAPFLHAGESLLPVYVALKIVPNSGPFPIFRFLRAVEPFLGDSDYLLTLSKERGLFLCLDGYDEIALTGTTQNYIQQELGKMLFASVHVPSRPGAIPRPGTISSSEAEAAAAEGFYSALKEKSRVWLTSRPQFIQHHPIGPIGSRQSTAINAVATIGIIGIGQNRESLVRRVFERYSSTHMDVGSLLDAEYFLQHIDQESDGEIRDMSFNPLFLTVMCYNYAQTVLAKQRPDLPVGATFDALILQCIDLLLLDLDEYKARQFSAAHKQAIENRRNQFVEEKKTFLRYLAGYSYLHDLNVFTESLLHEILLSYLAINQTENAAAIERTFVDKGSDRPSFVRQLIYCGLFVLVDSSRDERYYDFPHRRFREVLATSYFSEPHSYVQFVVQVAARGPAVLVEVTSVLARSRVVRSVDVQSQALALLLNEMLEAPKRELNYVGVTDAFVSLKPQDCDLSQVVSAFLSRVMDMRTPRFDASARVLDLRVPAIDDVPRFEEYIKDRCAELDPYGTAFGCSVLAKYRTLSLVHVVMDLLQSRPVPSDVSAVLLRALLRCRLDRKEIRDFLVRLVGQYTERWGLFGALFEAAAVINNYLYREVWNALDSHGKIDLLLYLARLVESGNVSPELWTRFIVAVDTPLEHAGVVSLRETVPQPGGSRTTEDMYFLSANTVSSICRKLEDLQKILDVGKIGDVGHLERALAIREALTESQRDISSKDPFRYAVISEKRVRMVSDMLAVDLARASNQFILDFSDIERTVNNAVGAIFDQAQFVLSRQTVAFTADESFVFSREALADKLKDHAQSLATWSAVVVADIREGWQRIPLPLERVPLYFV